MKNNKKKGFTLVELLVVIAILAILASVTVVGYMGFTEKARKSVAEQEAEQAETVIMGSLLEGAVKQGEYVFTYDGTTLTVECTGAGNVVALDAATQLELALADNGIKAETLTIVLTSGDDAKTRTVESITFKASNNYKASVFPFSHDHVVEAPSA